MDRHGLPPGTRLGDPSWLSTFRTNERLAARYRVGRVFLIGDAAHIHSPAGGQGMNTGIQDAVNLGWKLGHVLQGAGAMPRSCWRATRAERRPIAREVIRSSAQRLHVAFAGGTVARLARDLAVTIIGKLPAAQGQLQLQLSGDRHRLPRRPAPGALGNPPRRPARTDVGTRALDAPLAEPGTGAQGTLWPQLGATHHTLLLFYDGACPQPSAASPTASGARWCRSRSTPGSDPHQAVRKRYRVDGPGWVLLRPDQVVAARGDAEDLDLLADYVAQVIRPAAV